MTTDDNASMPCILVTGATGFLGTNLIKSFIGKGYKLRCTHRTPAPPSESSTELEWIRITDSCSQEAWEKLLLGVDYVIHLAALAHQIGDTELTEKDYMQANAIPSEAIAKAAKQAKVKRLVFISSIAAIKSESSSVIDSDTPEAPSTPYGKSKLEAERLIESALQGQDHTDWVALRPTLIYGPGNPGNMQRIARLISIPIPLPFGAFKNKRSFLYVENLISAIESCLTCSSVSKKCYIVCDDQSVSTAGLVKEIAAARGQKKAIFTPPAWTLKAIVSMGDFAKSHLNISTGVDSYSLDKLQSSLQACNASFKADASWSPPFTLSEGIAKTFQKTDS
ncbi:NAD-dependent epimerase/dehydratase family protein [Pelagicoccus sp. NFK12]|uniref:NAD-dependent epimerase/dehydratase family protein n=1 Tax=Pelagicoccus enzymogenes TaxID=2773457 RepID=A0A927FAE1_9BACT|nr:NAD-dependent epimerase/dehydratase family protein [Pelagicoccus enzymogenes]MBD5781448.1 NAD-dependent epimerase/dehydratase family protein [Pelagicoccus enzymogenes]